MKLFFLTTILAIAATSAESPLRKEYRDLVRNARHDSSSDSSDRQIHLPQLGFGPHNLPIHHHNHKSHKHHKHHKNHDDTDAGHILASWHQGDGRDKSSKSSSSSESQDGVKLESCTCQQFATTPSPTWGSWDQGTTGTTMYDYTTSSWYYPAKRSFQNDGYVITYSGFRLTGELSCFCPEMHMATSAPYMSGSMSGS